jgi:alginate O-acetyltransferase complex protein AlgJ
MDYFTFRVWEALVVRKFKNILPGPFYPNQEMTKVEKGDLGHHFSFADKREVRWVTDRYGYRKKNTEVRKHPIVIVGESNIAGSNLTQKEILSEVLENQLKISVYPYAPVGSINSFLKDKRFIDQPPDILIFSRVERELLDLPILKEPKDRRWASKLRQKMNQNEWFQNSIIQLDRLYKLNMLHFFRASLRRCIAPPPENFLPRISSPYGRILFLQGAEANRDVPKEKLNQIIQIILSYNKIVRSRGVRFIFVPIPNKENIFYEYLQTRRPVFLEQLISALRDHKIEAIDTQKPFEETFQKNRILLHYSDDTHWNANGVKLTAELIKNWIEKKE